VLKVDAIMALIEHRRYFVSNIWQCHAKRQKKQSQ